MKKLFFIAAAAIGLFASCAKNEVIPTQDNPQITFQAVTGKVATKALIDGTDYLGVATADKAVAPSFGSAAFFSKEKWTNGYATSGLYIPEQEITYQSALSTWSTASPFYWPVQGTTEGSGGYLTFFSYSPWLQQTDGSQTALNSATEISNTSGVVISSWDVDKNQTTDVMVADVKADQTENTSNGGYTGVPTVFRHKLSQIVAFEVRLADDYVAKTAPDYSVGDQEVFINNISINNVKHVGTYTSGRDVNVSAPGTWVPTTALKSYTNLVDLGAQANGTKLNEVPSTGFNRLAINGNGSYSYLLVLPQSFLGEDDSKLTGNIIVNYTVRQYYGAGQYSTNYVDTPQTGSILLADIHSVTTGEGDADVTTAEWQMNKKITYRLIIDLKKGNEILWAPSIVDWENQSVTEDGELLN